MAEITALDRLSAESTTLGLSYGGMMLTARALGQRTDRHLQSYLRPDADRVSSARRLASGFEENDTLDMARSHHDVLDLTHVPLIGQGTKRRVFHHPTDAALCIKIVRPDLSHWTRPLQGWKRLFYRSGAQSMQLDELREQFALHSRGGCPDFITAITGMITTNLGPGLVVETVRNHDGTLAPDVRQLILRQQYDERIEAAVEVFFRELVASPVVVSDLTPQNICCAKTRDGYRCVMVDGWGDDSLLRLKSFSETASRLSKRAAIASCRKKIRRYIRMVAASTDQAHAQSTAAQEGR